MDLIFRRINVKILENKIKILNKDIIKIIETYNENDYMKYIRIDKNKYNKTIIEQNDILQLSIITWYNRQYSTIHNHLDGGCIMKILEGNLTETRYNKDKTKLLTNNFKKNETNIITNFDEYSYHQIYNNNDNIAVSMHLYKIK